MAVKDPSEDIKTSGGFYFTLIFYQYVNLFYGPYISLIIKYFSATKKGRYIMDLGKRREIGEKIKYERKYRKLTLNECGDLLGVSGSFLGLVERGERMLSLEKVIMFCNIFGVDADYILGLGSSIRENKFCGIKDDIIFELEKMTEKDYNILLSIIKAYKKSSREDFPYRVRK